MAFYRAGGAKFKAGTTSHGGTVNLGFKPKYVAIQCRADDTHRACAVYDERISTTKQVRALVGATTTCATRNISVAAEYVCTFASITDTGFSVNTAPNNNYGSTIYYYAIG